MTGASARPWLMLVTDRRLVGGGDLVAAVRAAVAGGVDLVQLREKDLDDGSLEQLAQALLAAVGAAARLVINGRSELALKLGEPVGLHLPEHQPLPARRPSFWGRSVHSPQAAAAAAQQGARYLVAGPVYPTSSKPGATLLGPQGLQEICRHAAPAPVLAIGGIRAERVAEVIRCGASGVAVREAILAAPDPARAAARLRQALDEASGSFSR